MKDETVSGQTGNGGDRPNGGERPLLRVVQGNPDDTELAVLTAVVSALAAAPAAADEPPAQSRWGAPQLRHALRPGPDAWRFSFR